MKNLKKFLRIEKAVAAIEFAILAPVFFLIFFGIIEVGLTMFVDSTLNSALRAASRAGITQGYISENDFRNAMKPYMAGVYRTAADGMEVSAQIVNCNSNNLTSIGTTIKNGTFFTQSFNLAACAQSNAMVVYGARYKWGGFTNLMSPILPDYLYAVTVVRNEQF